MAYGKSDMVAHAPVTTENLPRGGMTVLALAEAAQTTSDNPAANLLLKLLGGPAGFTAILRPAGDDNATGPLRAANEPRRRSGSA